MKISDELIRSRAYELTLEEGYPAGRHRQGSEHAREKMEQRDAMRNWKKQAQKYNSK